MSKVDLNLYTTATREGDQYKIGDIPPKLWAQFVERAKLILPEHGDNAWSAFLCNAIASVCDGNSHTFVMTDIPNDAKEAMDQACEGARCRPDQVIGQLYRSAQLGKIHILNITDDEQRDLTHTMVIVGLPDRAWAGWDRLGRQANVEPGYFLGMMLEMAANDQLRFNSANQAGRPAHIPGYPSNGQANTRQRNGQGMDTGSAHANNRSSFGDNRSRSFNGNVALTPRQPTPNRVDSNGNRSN